MVLRPLHMATVGETTSSMTRPNGSVMPVDSNCSRVWISGSNLENRAISELSDGGSPAGCRRALVDMGLPLELADGVNQLADRLNLRLLVHGDENVELVFNIGDEVEHRQAIPLEVLGETGLVRDLDPFLVERLDEGFHPCVGLGSIGHARVLVLRAGFRNRMGRKEGEGLMADMVGKRT